MMSALVMVLAGTPPYPTLGSLLPPLPYEEQGLVCGDCLFGCFLLLCAVFLQ